METIESCVPPGFRFHPTDEELVGYYLKKKVASRKIDLDVIKDVDLYRIEPWDLQEKCRIEQEEQREWYFFSHKDKKYPTGTRTNRATMAGFWKATGRDKSVYDKQRLIGMRKTLVFYKGRAPSGQKTDWIIHEYRLETDENAPPQEEGWVVCRAFKKRTTCQTRNINESWDSSYFCDQDRNGANSILDSLDFFPSQRPALLCKQELEAENIKYSTVAAERFLQLPQLESPKVQFLKTPNSHFMRESDHEDTRFAQFCCESDEELGKFRRENMTDWRALDRFVASQLSQEERCEEGEHQGHEECYFGHERENNDLVPFEGLNGGVRDLLDHAGLLNAPRVCNVSVGTLDN